jgi:actin-like protein 6A
MSTYTVGRDCQAMVCDIGSHSTKIGYAGDDHPSAIYNSDGTRSNFTKGGPRRDFVTRCCCSGGDDDGAYQLANPIDPVTGWLFSSPSSNFNEGGNGNSVDAWESHELVSHHLRHAFEHALGLDNSSSNEQACHHPLLLLDKPHPPPALRQRLLELLFETHNLPALFLLRDAVASCYAVGRTTGTVVDAGHSATMVTPVYEGFVETRGILRNVAVVHVTSIYAYLTLWTVLLKHRVDGRGRIGLNG